MMMETPRPKPPKMRVVQAAGAVVWRLAENATPFPGTTIPQNPQDIEVLLVHRPRYGDWSWPKGKRERGESLVATAVREVEEETGVVVCLGAPLTTQRYRLGLGATKEVYYWVGSVNLGQPAYMLRSQVQPAPSSEIDYSAWLSVDEASELLTRRGDKRLLEELLQRLEDKTLVTQTVVFACDYMTSAADKSGNAQVDLAAQSTPENRSATAKDPQKPLRKENPATVSNGGNIGTTEPKKPAFTPASVFGKRKSPAATQHEDKLSVNLGSIAALQSFAQTNNHETANSASEKVAKPVITPAIFAKGKLVKGLKNPGELLDSDSDDPDTPAINSKPITETVLPKLKAEPKELKETSDRHKRAGADQSIRLIPILSAYGIEAVAETLQSSSKTSLSAYAVLGNTKHIPQPELSNNSEIKQFMEVVFRGAQNNSAKQELKPSSSPAAMPSPSVKEASLALKQMANSQTPEWTKPYASDTTPGYFSSAYAFSERIFSQIVEEVCASLPPNLSAKLPELGAGETGTFTVLVAHLPLPLPEQKNTASSLIDLEIIP